MTQNTFDFDGHEANLERVSSRVAASILRFCERHERFHADDLRRKVMSETGIAAPASADRILRQLRQRGVIDYVVLSRRESLYLVTKVTKGAA